ncbi:MAG TPA: hypothetical protein VK937_05825 [Candidatus Limnocylindria bacterium]|jgi:hypothetical protein|nr:hypothetical protein [Candidatus Limnocylindria bacterium]
MALSARDEDEPKQRRYLGQLKTDRPALLPELSSVLDAGFVEEKGCVLLAAKARGSEFARATEDETGYECFINHLHVEDLGVDDHLNPQCFELRPGK